MERACRTHALSAVWLGAGSCSSALRAPPAASAQQARLGQGRAGRGRPALERPALLCGWAPPSPAGGSATLAYLGAHCSCSPALPTPANPYFLHYRLPLLPPAPHPLPPPPCPHPPAADTSHLTSTHDRLSPPPLSLPTSPLHTTNHSPLPSPSPSSSCRRYLTCRCRSRRRTWTT